MPGMLRSRMMSSMVPPEWLFRMSSPRDAAIDGDGIAAEAADQFLKDAALSWIVFDNENANGHARRTSSQV